MRSTLILQPIHNSSTDILKSFAQGKPLSADQLNYLDWHYQQLSSPEFDPVYKYYLEASKRKHKISTTFLQSSEELTAESIKQLKKRLELFLKEKNARAFVGFTQEQFLKLKGLLKNELIFWHGNQFITGAAPFAGSIPPVLYFQWGKFFGIVKYVFLAGEKILQSNILIYFEDMQNRYLDQCVADYKKRLEMEFDQQQKLIHEHKINPEFNHFLIKTPTLSFDAMK